VVPQIGGAEAEALLPKVDNRVHKIQARGLPCTKWATYGLPMKCLETSLVSLARRSPYGKTYAIDSVKIEFNREDGSMRLVYVALDRDAAEFDFGVNHVLASVKASKEVKFLAEQREIYNTRITERGLQSSGVKLPAKFANRAALTDWLAELPREQRVRLEMNKATFLAQSQQTVQGGDAGRGQQVNVGLGQQLQAPAGEISRPESSLGPVSEGDPEDPRGPSPNDGEL
jgi:hypothetical protein